MNRPASGRECRGLVPPPRQSPRVVKTGRLTRRELLEIRRAAHEFYLKRRHGFWWTLAIERGEAVVRCGPSDYLTVRFPARELLERDALSRHGF